MMRLNEAVFAMSAIYNGPDLAVSGISTDSRSVGAGQLFIALKGERFDGAAYVGEARSKGAAAAVVEGADFKIGEAGDIPLLLVKNSRRALADLAAYWRNRFDMPIVAVTGSNGKTTVKEMLAGILRETCAAEAQSDAVLATQGNLNNDIGVPLTLLNLRAQHRYAVVEIGMNHPGEVRYCTLIVRPDVALINNAQEAHLEGLGDIAAVARAKGELFEGLAADGIAVINNDDPSSILWHAMAQGKRTLTFGLESKADVSARFRPEQAGNEMDFDTPQGSAQTFLPAPGVHNVRNALAATAAAVALDVPLSAIARGLSRFSGVKGRLARREGARGATLNDDTYNANPGSVAAAITVLATASGKKILVLGDMGELGKDAALLHRRIGVLAREAKIDGLYTLGEMSRHASEEFGRGRHFDELAPLVAALEEVLDENVTVLVKGSRFMQMERVVQALAVRE